MSKSRSGDSEGGGSGSSSLEEAHPTSAEHRAIAELGSSESFASAECAQTTADASSLVSANTDSTMPASSPPPSYNRIIEEIRDLRINNKQRGTASDDEETETESEQQAAPPPKKAPILYKSSKDFYRAMAKQWGITCKMSDNCRCLDCQSRYFDCGYEKYQDYDKYHEQSDGGLSASTPMFVSEVMHGSACLLL